MPDSVSVTQMLNSLEDGNERAAEKLLPLVYDELRRVMFSPDGRWICAPAGRRNHFPLVLWDLADESERSNQYSRTT